MKKGIHRILLLTTLFCMLIATTASALELFRYQHTDSISVSFDIKNGIASCGGVLKPSNKNYSSSITVILQKQTNGTWKNVTSWSNSATSGPVSVSGTKTLTERGNYRVVVNGVVKNSSGTVLEQPSITSPTKTY